MVAVRIMTRRYVCRASRPNVLDQGASLGDDLATLLLLDGGLAEREAPGAMAHLGAADEPAWFAGPEVIDFQVRFRGCLTFVGKRVCDSGERLVGQGRDRSAMHDRSPGGGKSMRI